MNITNILLYGSIEILIIVMASIAFYHYRIAHKARQERKRMAESLEKQLSNNNKAQEEDLASLSKKVEDIMAVLDVMLKYLIPDAYQKTLALFKKSKK